jgi:hypothetical protein
MQAYDTFGDAMKEALKVIITNGIMMDKMDKAEQVSDTFSSAMLEEFTLKDQLAFNDSLGDKNEK